MTLTHPIHPSMCIPSRARQQEKQAFSETKKKGIHVRKHGERGNKGDGWVLVTCLVSIHVAALSRKEKGERRSF